MPPPDRFSSPPLSPDVHIAELWRLVPVLAVVVIMLLLMWEFFRANRAEPTRAKRHDRTVFALLFGIIVALVRNWLSPYPPLPGTKAFAVVSSVVALLYVAAIIRAARRRP